MQLGKAFSYIFEDERWIEKVVIGGLFILTSFLILPMFIVMGYEIEIIEHVAAGEGKPLPEWTNIGEKLSKGFFLAVTVFVYELPLLLLFFIFFLQILLFGVLQGLGNAAQIASGILAIIASLVFVFGMILISAYTILIYLLTPAIYIRYSLTNEIREGLNFKEIWQFTKSNFINVLIIILLSYIAGLIGGLGIFACFIGVIFTSFYSLTVIGYLYGELARTTNQKRKDNII